VPGVVLSEGRAVGVVFALNGAVMGNWVARIPAAADQTHSSPAILGLALLSVAVGAVIAMPLVGRLCARVDSRHVVTAAAASNCLALPLLALARSPLALAGALAVFGASTGATDVSMNVNAVTAIRNAGRPLMPLFHGGFSTGGMIGAGLGGLAAAHLGMRTHFTLAAAVGLLVLAIVRRRLPADPSSPEQPAGQQTPEAAPARQFDATIAVLGAIVFCVAVGEGATGDWSALYMRDVMHSGATLAAAGYTVFSVAMAASRFSGAAVLGRFSPARTMVGSCALAATGALVVVVAPAAPVALLGFAVVGAGLAYGFPVALNAAGAHPSGSGPAIGVVTAIGYTGFLAGPPLIGFVSQWAGLRAGLSLVAVAAAIGLLLAVSRRRLLQAGEPNQVTEPA